MTTTARPDDGSAELARKMWRTLEPYHSIVYFTPHAEAAYAALGIEGRAGYFASRAAPLGRVGAEVVISTFYNFHPALVRRAIPSAWEKAEPSAVVEARQAAADAALRGILGDEVDGQAIQGAAVIAERAARAAGIEGRPLFAGHAGLPWPSEPHLVLWHALTLLREHRGDGHIAALVMAGLDPCEALITHADANDTGVSSAVLQRSRAWPDDEWAAARERLVGRGIVDRDGLSAEGRALRERVEAETDRAAAPPWTVVSADEAAQLRATVRPWSRAIVESAWFGIR